MVSRNCHLEATICQIFIGLKGHSHDHLAEGCLSQSCILVIAARCSSDLTPIADLSERKIEVFAVPTHPISNSFCKRLLYLLLLALALEHHDLVFICMLIRILHVLVLLVVILAGCLPVTHALKRDLFGPLINLLVLITLIDDHLAIHQI